MLLEEIFKKNFFLTGHPRSVPIYLHKEKMWHYIYNI